MTISTLDIDKLFAVKYANDIKSVIKASPFASIGINFFAHVKIFNDGTRLILCSNEDWLRCFLNYYFNQGMTSKSFNAYQTGYLLCSGLAQQQICSIMRNEFDIDQGILVIFKHDSYCEINIYASTRENYKINNFYINNLDALHRFALFFKEKCKPVIEKAHKDRMSFPSMAFNNPRLEGKEDFDSTDKIFSISKHLKNELPVRRYYFTENMSQYLTEKELECITHIINGHSAKELARLMNIAPKTAEVHWANIRSKLNGSSKSEIINKLLNAGLINIQSV